MKNYTYLLIDLGCILVPFLASFYKPHAFRRTWPAFFKACSIVGLVFVVWDIVFTKMGVWGFNPDYLTGLNVFNLPIEEVLFFFCIPYACVFTYFALQYLFTNIKGHKTSKYVTIFLIALLTLLAVVFYDRMYTVTTFSLVVLFLSYCLYRKIDLTYIYMAYVAILPFFYVSNGILTGSMIEEPIVWYNNAENMGVRMFTIPVEDTMYGFLLIASIEVLYDYFLTRKIGQSMR